MTIFTQMAKESDFIIAFFPCTHFAIQMSCGIGCGLGVKIPYDKRSVQRLIKRNQERARFFELYLKFTFICQHKGIRTIIENPASSGNKNYLVQFSPIPVAYHEKNRSLYGDSSKKPTNFFAINFDMIERTIPFTPNVETKAVYKVGLGCKIRSEISSLYAQDFYARFIKDSLRGEN